MSFLEYSPVPGRCISSDWIFKTIVSLVLFILLSSFVLFHIARSIQSVEAFRSVWASPFPIARSMKLVLKLSGVSTGLDVKEF
jgi:hypothetical protein